MHRGIRLIGSFRSFKAYVHASVLACNLLTVARHVLAAAKAA